MGFLKNIRDTFKEKNNKKLYWLVALFFVGVALLLFSKSIGGLVPEKEQQNDPPVSAEVTVTSYEEELTARLESILSLVDGAGEVRVMLTFSQGTEKIIAADYSSDESSTDEKDVNGGSRTIEQSKSEEKTVIIKNADGSETPIVLKEYKPQIEGAIIVAKGGDSIFIKDALIKAACAVLGVESHKVLVLKMK